MYWGITAVKDGGYTLMKNRKGSFTGVIKNFFRVNKKSVPGFILVILLIVSCNIIGAVSNYCIGGLIDSIGDWNKEQFKKLLIFILIIQVLYLILSYISNYCASKVSEVSIRRIRLYTYDCIMKADMEWLNNIKVGDVISRVNSDLESMVNVVNNFLTWEISNIVMFIIGVVGCSLLNWKLTVISIITFPILGTLQMKVGHPISSYSEKRAKAEGKSNAKFMDLLNGHAVAKIFGRNDLREQYNAEVDESVKWGIKAAALEFKLYPIQALISFIPFLVMYGTAVYLIGQGELTLGGMVTFTLIFLFISNPINSLSGQINFIYEAMGLSSRIFELWNITSERDGGSMVKGISDIPVEFSNVEFSYKTELQQKQVENKVLNGINFIIEKGQQVAVVGNSGQGKSTIIKLLVGFCKDYSGKIKIFGTELKEWNLKELRKHISYVGQEAFLFPDSIFNNIKLGNEEASEEEILQVIHEMGLDKLDIYAKMGEAGVKLSGGQKQRICIARALLKNADLLLLDEPTSALDTESEYFVSQSLKSLTKDKTCIIVAHRLSAIRNADRILCLQDGKIAESGTFDEVMSRNGIIKRLFSQQLKEEVK